MDYKELEKDDPDNKQDAQTSLSGSNPDIVVWRGVEYDLSKGEEYVGCDGPVVGESDPLPPGYGRTSYFPGGPKTFVVLMWCRGCCEVGSHWMTDCPNKKTEAFKKNIRDMAGPNFPWDEYHKTKTYHDSHDDDDGETNQTKAD
ncbi:uncharacterized protein LOC126803324 [Argentina anserina]|uniref:uncharacterized protein LOC126803324 n=1 Tax=Argentina anserina TaxID=57926 RepID=UPI0021762CCC|nr:uncharacterized protein LOC126803324 [Potentilla anserina]